MEKADTAREEEGSTRREYIKALLEYVKDDVRQDYPRVTGALALAAVFVTHVQIAELQRLNQWETYVLFAGLAFLAMAAVAYFHYISKTHQARRPLTTYLLTLNAQQATKHVNAVFESRKRKWEFRLGTALFAVGVGLLAVVLWALVTASPNAAG